MEGEEREKTGCCGGKCLQIIKSLKFTEKFYLLFTLIIIKVPCMIACWNNGKQDIFW